MKRRQFLATGAAAAAGPFVLKARGERRPNILFAISDDQSWPHAGAYGSKMVNTPAFDRVAREGCLITNAYAAAPQCSPNRASLLTGRPIWKNRESGTHNSYFLDEWPLYTDLLEEAGYHIGLTGKGWGPGRYRDSDRTRNPAGPSYTKRRVEQTPYQSMNSLDYAANFEDFLNDRPDGAPFHFWYGASEPHRGYERGSGLKAGKRPSDAEVPGFLPDHEIVRGDLLDYAVEIDYFDTHLNRMLKMLEERGELDNTIVVVTSDNGMPFPGAKATLYEYGLHMPMAIRWAEGMNGGRRLDDFIGFIDLAPTFLEAAGVERPDSMDGRSFLSSLTSNRSGLVDKNRDHIVAGRERHSHARYDNWGCPSRCIREGDWLYIRNFKPERSFAGDPPEYYDIDGGPTKSFMIEHKGDPDIKPLFEHCFEAGPAEQLFHVKDDPACLNNLADDDAQASRKTRMWARLLMRLERDRDPRTWGRGDVFESYPRFAGMRPSLGGFAESGEYNPEYQY